MRAALANALSLLGHPVVVMPLAAIVALRSGGESATPILGIVLGLTTAVLIYAFVQVRSGRWRDMDASAHHERTELNLGLAGALAVATALSWAIGVDPRVITGLALACAIIMVALLMRTRFKLSLHIAFAVYAAFVASSSIAASCAFALLACALAWARLALRRHDLPDVIAGALTGAVAGIALLLIA